MDWQTNLADIDNNQLRQALQDTNVPALMAALVHLTNNCEHLRGDIRPLVIPLAEEADGLTEDQRQAARDIAFQALSSYRDKGTPELPAPPEDAIIEAMHYLTGEAIPAEQMELMREELNLFGEDRRRVRIEKNSVPADYRVMVIGAGMSGILAAIRLQDEGIDYIIVDKNPEIGGTWYENTYPGCQVDSDNHLYNYIFAANNSWPYYFSNRDTLFEYFQNVAARHGIAEKALLGTQVVAASYDEDSETWRVTLRDQDGTSREENVNAITW